MESEGIKFLEKVNEGFKEIAKEKDGRLFLLLKQLMLFQMKSKKL